jgi:hypothetical protein
MDFKSAFKIGNSYSKLTAGYDVFYQHVIGDEKIDSVLELGIFEGDSLRGWRALWPTAIIEGGDFDFKFDKSLLQEFDIKQIDSTLKEDADKFGQYDIIIDDANHHWKWQTATFYNFYNKAKKFYVLEDVLGEYGMDKLNESLPRDVLDRATIFTSPGPTRNFRHSNHSEPKGRYKIIFFDKRI